MTRPQFVYLFFSCCTFTLFSLGVLWIKPNEHFMCKSWDRHIFIFFFVNIFFVVRYLFNYFADSKICVAFLLVFELLSSFCFLDTSMKSVISIHIIMTCEYYSWLSLQYSMIVSFIVNFLLTPEVITVSPSIPTQTYLFMCLIFYLVSIHCALGRMFLGKEGKRESEKARKQERKKERGRKKERN